MEALTRLVTESLARHGFDRPLDYRRLHWSRWFRCESHHSLLVVPSKPGVFAVAEEIVPAPKAESREPKADSKRMLAVTQFFEDDDMAYVLDRMLSRQNPMRERLVSGRYFIRFVVIEDASQRRSACSALNQWIANSSEKASGIASHFASSLELTQQTEYEGQASLFEEAQDHQDHVETGASPVPPARSAAALGRSPGTPQNSAPHPNSGAAPNIHSPTPFPSGF
ncbi:MAG TPA: hypothetical protein VE377_10115 [Candidatus Dormibacteraeota bacterium]|nr:hypothetical protein [Candidatus Dormibacteraeota bacterium]